MLHDFENNLPWYTPPTVHLLCLRGGTLAVVKTGLCLHVQVTVITGGESHQTAMGRSGVSDCPVCVDNEIITRVC